MARNKTKVTAEPGKQELFIVREFDASRVLVFKAFTDPKLYVQWLGPRKYKMNLEKFEPTHRHLRIRRTTREGTCQFGDSKIRGTTRRKN